MKKILPILVLAQFFGTSLWFAGNAVLPDLIRVLNLPPGALGQITGAVQLGFIAGTLVFALLAISDRFSPSLVFLFSSILAAIFNIAVTINSIGIEAVLLARFCTGFFLAGIYPVGMKIAADYYEQGLGKSLGFLLGALVIGTAFPHLLKSFTTALPWKYVMYTTSLLAVCGGVALFLFIPDGPHRHKGQKLKLNAFLSGFSDRNFRAAAYGYFGHMWELYAFWAFVPVLLQTFSLSHPSSEPFNIPLCSFLIIAIGGPACIAGGYLSQKFRAKKVAFTALSVSFICCLISPLAILYFPKGLFLLFLFIWGMVVIPDSPMFSSMVALNAPKETKGSSITIVNSIGFSITIVSILLLNSVYIHSPGPFIYLLLAPGPALGLIALANSKRFSTK